MGSLGWSTDFASLRTLTGDRPGKDFRRNFNGQKLLTVKLYLNHGPRIHRGSDTAIAALKRANRVTRRRNSLRPKLIPPLEVKTSTPMPEINSETLGPDRTFPEMFDEIDNGRVEGQEGTALGQKNLGEDENETLESMVEKSKEEGFWGALEKTAVESRKERETWGAGTDAIFIVSEGANGEIEKVSVDENAILKRCGIDSGFSGDIVDDYAMELAHERTAMARVIAEEIESGAFKPPRTGTVYKFVKDEKSKMQRFSEGLRSVATEVQDPVKLIGSVGFWKTYFSGLIVVSGLALLWNVKKLLFSKTPLEGKEWNEETRRILARKAKARMQRERLDQASGSTAIVSDIVDVNTARGNYKGMLNLNELEMQKMELAVNTLAGKLPIDDAKLKQKILEIRANANEARRIENQKAENSRIDGNEADNDMGNVVDVQLDTVGTVTDIDFETNSRSNSVSIYDAQELFKGNGKAEMAVPEKTKNMKKAAENVISHETLLRENEEKSSFPFDTLDGFNNSLTTEATKVSIDGSKATDPADNSKEENIHEMKGNTENNLVGDNDKNSLTNTEPRPKLDWAGEDSSSIDVKNLLSNKHLEHGITQNGGSFGTNIKMGAEGIQNGSVVSNMVEEQPRNGTQSISTSSERKVHGKPRVITSLEEARALLAAKRGKQIANDSNSKNLQESDSGKMFQESNSELQLEPANHSNMSDLSRSGEETNSTTSSRLNIPDYEKFRPDFQKFKLKEQVIDEQDLSRNKTNASGMKVANFGNNESIIENDKRNDSGSTKVEQNFVDKDSSDEEDDRELTNGADQFDLEENPVLNEIVMKVYSNEQSGKKPFEGLSSKHEEIFYEGIQKQIDREAERVNKWIEERMENMDYGKDVIGVDDPPEVYMARWKDPDKMRKSNLHEKLLEDRQKFIKDRMGQHPRTFSETEKSSLDADLLSSSAFPSVPSMEASSNSNDKGFGKNVVSSSGKRNKTVSNKSGKQNKTVRKEKKRSEKANKQWSEGFKKIYEVEKDPKRKALLEEVGQDLDSWITEEERDEMRKFFAENQGNESKIFDEMEARLKYEKEKFGREAMLRKYSEYKSARTDQRWWLNLPYVLCIAIRRNKDGEESDGLYSLEMRSMLEEDRKPIHVIAFQDQADAKNFYHLLAKDLESKGDATAAVVPRHPKKLYEEAKSEGYEMTVLKKSQIKMTVDQPFEELESIITEIGSAVYYDEYLEDNSIDMTAVIDDALGFRKHRTQ